jgi:hypothetical protein
VLLGEASYKILVGSQVKDQNNDKTTESKDALLYFQKLGAEFLNGFYFGTNVGAFNDNDLFECM